MGHEEAMAEKKWCWEEVTFIPNGVSAPDLLRFQGHIFIKSNIVEELKSKGQFKRRERKKTKKKGKYRRYQ